MRPPHKFFILKIKRLNRALFEVVSEFGKNRTLSRVAALVMRCAGAGGCQADVCPNWTSDQRGKTVRVEPFSEFVDTIDARSMATT